MWIELEGGKPLNLDQVTNIEAKHHSRTAIAWTAGVVITSDSKILYEAVYPFGEAGGFDPPPYGNPEVKP